MVSNRTVHALGVLKFVVPEGVVAIMDEAYRRADSSAVGSASVVAGLKGSGRRVRVGGGRGTGRSAGRAASR